MALSFEEIKNKVTGQQRSGTESFDEIKARVSQMNMTSPLTADDVDAWFAKSRELEGKTNQYLSDSGTYDGWKGASSPYDELHKHRLQEASVRAWLNSNKDALGDRYDALSAQLGDYSGGLGRLSSGIRDTSANWRNSPIGELDASISANEQKLTELRAQLDETGDQWHKKTLSSLLSERKPIQNQIKELESENNRLQDELNAYKKEYFEASIPSDPDGIKKMEADIDAKIAALQSKLDAKPFEKGPGKILSKILTDEGMKVVQPQDENAIAQEIKTLKDQKEQLNNALKRVEYAQIPKAEDFEEFAKYVPSKDDESKMGFWEKMGSRLTGGGYDRDYEYINDENGARAEIKSYISNMRSDSPSLWEDGSSSQERAGYDFITDDEVKIYNYIYAKQGKQAAKDYLDTLDLTARAREDDRIKWEQMANENAPLASTLSVLAGQYKPAGYIESVKDYITGQGIDPNSHYNRYSKAQSTVRETVSKNIEDSVEGVWGKVGSFGYQTGMSMADFLLSLIAGGGNQSFTLAVMGSGAAADTVISAKEKGLDDTRAFALGTLAGAAEVVFEKVSLDHLFKIKSKAGIASKILDVLSQAGVEGSEEIFTDIANELADRLISGDLSDYSLTVKSYIDAGLSETEAKKKANVDFAEQLALSGLGGFLSGGVLGAGAVTLNNTIGTRAIGRDVIRSGDVNSTISEGLNLDVNDPLYRAAAELAMRQTEGGKLSARKVGELETGLEAKTLDRLESLRGQMARILSGDTQNGDETAPLGTVHTKSKTAPNGPSNAQDGHSANADVQTNVPYTVNVEAAKPLDAQASMGNSAVTVQGVESVQDGDVTVTLSDGTKVPLYDVEIADPQIRQLYDTAAKYDTNTAKAFVSGFDGSLPISTYQSAFDYFMTQAKHGVSMDEAMQHAGLAGQMMSPVSRQTAYFAGENLQSSGSRGNMGAENVATGGMNNVSVRQDTGSVRGFNGGRETGNGQRSGVSGESETKYRRIREVAGREQKEKPRQQVKISSNDGKLSFDAVRPEALTQKQQTRVQESANYGYELHYYQKGTVFNDGTSEMVIDRPAFMIPGIKAIFAMDGEDIDFLHHELFHQFLSQDDPKSIILYNDTKRSIDKYSKAFKEYQAKSDISYKTKTPISLLIEEITCDLCEYAMSGSETMYNRLNGLFEGDTLETLAEQAREVFEANREAYQAGKGQKSADTRFYMDDAVEEVRGIMAYHGMTTEDLDSAVQSGHPPLHTDGSGDISLLFRPEASLSYDTETPVQDTGFGTRLSSIAGRMAGGRTADAMESSRALLDVLSRSHTKEDIRKSLESLGKFSVTDEIVADIFSLSNDMAESPGMVYRDAAGLEDVVAAVVPDTLDEDLKTQLNAAGIKTVEYKAGDDADRVRALNEAPELRFYLEDISPVDVDLLTEENQALREQVETLRGEFQLTKGHKVKPASIGKLADTILKETSSSYDKGTLVKNLDALFSYIANDPDANFDEAMDVSVEIANSVLRESSALDSTLYEKYWDMREYFRKTAISLDEDIRAGMDYERFRKEHFGGFRLTNDGASLDSLWPEISGRWPEFFSPDTPIQDQPQVVADALRTVRPSYVNPYGMDATEAAYDLAMRVYEEYFNLPEIHTFADKKKAELTQLRAKYENRIQAIRKGYKAKEQALVQEQRQKRKDLKDENRLRLAAQMEKVREQRKAAADKRWESALVRRYKPRIIRDTMELGRWLTHPTDKKHVPEPFRKAVAEFVNTIDFSSDRLNSKGKPTMRTMAMQELFNRMNTILKSESGTFEEAQAIFDGADPDLIPNMADLIQNAERVRIEDMTGTQLGELAHVVAALKSMLTNANTLISGERTRAAEQVAKGIHMDLMGQEAKEYTGLLGLGKRLVNYDMMDAPSYFEELGDTAYREIYKPLRRGFDRKIQNTTEAVAYMQRLLKGIDTDTWSGPKAEKHTFKVRGGTVSLTTAQIMSLYELSKRDQARGHILGGGIRPSDTVKKMRIDKTFRPVTLTAQDLKEIVGTLTPEQRAVADGIADFFKVTAEWGNEVSMKLYGYRKFTEQNYFPIVSDKNYLTTMQGDLKRPDAVLKNLGMTKSTVAGANNPIMVEDIFDVFTRQADQMGSYNAFVVPLSDLSKVFNFKASEPGGEVQGSIKESLERALGHDAVTYWNKLVEDINGVSKQTPPTIGDKLLSNMKAAAVGANLLVIIQQPTAYLRAAALIDPKYLAKGLATKSDIDEMNEYAPIARWKDLGFFEMDTARGMKDILMSKKGLRDIAMKPAGWADTKTWGKLWNAVKAEIRDTTAFEPGTVEFLEAAGERFSEIIDRTQVVDSVFHRSQMMRSKNFINKTVTSFMSEPTKAYNMLRSAVRDVQKNGWKKGRRRLIRVAVTHAATNIATALAAALIDAMRDDDEEKKWAEKYWSAVGENTLDNLSPLNMLPYLKDVASLLSGYNLTRQEMAGLTDVVNAGRAWMSYFQGDSKYSVPWLIKNSAASISKLTGIPVAAATRDLEALVRSGIRAFGSAGAPTARLEYILDTFYYPVIPKNASRYAGRAYDAYREDNPKLAKDILEAMEKGGVSEEKIAYYMRKNLREQDDRVAEAGRAKLDGNMSAYARIVGEIRNDGFDRDWVIGAVDGWVSKLESAAKEKEEGKTKELKESLKEITDSGADQEWAENTVNRLADSQKKRPGNDSDDEEEYEGLFESSDVVLALEAGDLKEAKAVIQEMTDNGKKEYSIRSSVTRYYKPVYQEMYREKDETGMRKLRETLVGLGIGYKSGDFTRWIQDMKK
jgi:hypothetical protein